MIWRAVAFELIVAANFATLIYLHSWWLLVCFTGGIVSGAISRRMRDGRARLR